MKVKRKICKNCGKEFDAYTSLVKCCSYKCENILAKKKDKEKKAKKKEKEKTSFTTLVKVLDALVSKYIRLKYSDSKGMCKCISCDAVKHYSEMHNAHFIKRGVRKYRFEETNLMPACPKCNLFDKENHLLFYTIYQIQRIGKDKVDEMMKEAREVGKKPSKEYLMKEIEFYKEEVKALESQKD